MTQKHITRWRDDEMGVFPWYQRLYRPTWRAGRLWARLMVVRLSVATALALCLAMAVMGGAGAYIAVGRLVSSEVEHSGEIHLRCVRSPGDGNACICRD